MSEHTKGPWFADPRPDSSEIVDNEGRLVAQVPEMGPCRRIVACVNALEGLDPAAVRELIEAARAVESLLYEYVGYGEAMRKYGRGFSGTDRNGDTPEFSARRLTAALERLEGGE